MDEYRKTSNERTVKYDSNPANDYSDGYNAGRRYEEPKKKSKKPWWLIPLLLLALLGLLLWVFSNEKNDLLDFGQDTTTITTPEVDVNAPNVTVPDVDVDVDKNPDANTSAEQPSTLPKTGE